MIKLLCRTILQGKLEWATQSPLAFSFFHNILFWKSPLECLTKKEYQNLTSTFHCRNVKGNVYDQTSPCVDLTSIKDQASKFIHPVLTADMKCTMLLLTNLAQPDWISIECKMPTLSHVHCAINEATFLIRNYTGWLRERNVKFCNTSHFVVNGSCFRLVFMSSSVQKRTLHVCKLTLKYADKRSAKTMVTLFSSVQADSLPLLFLHGNHTNNFYKMKCKKFSTLDMCKTTKVSKEGFCGYLSVQEENMKYQKGANIFHCSNGGYILSTLRCDSKKDCLNDDSDECDCDLTRPFTNVSSLVLTTGANCSLNRCPVVYFQNSIGSCLQYNPGIYLAGTDFFSAIHHKSNQLHNEIQKKNTSKKE